MATQPNDDEQIVVPRIREILTAPVQTKENRIRLLFGIAVALATFAPQPFGALAAFCIGVLAVEYKR